MVASLALMFHGALPSRADRIDVGAFVTEQLVSTVRKDQPRPKKSYEKPVDRSCSHRCQKIVVDISFQFAKLNLMKTATSKPMNSHPKASQAQQEFAKLLSTASIRGFHGTAGITLSVQDGHIQHLKIHLERMVK